jgi:hypothetical protein
LAGRQGFVRLRAPRFGAISLRSWIRAESGKRQPAELGVRRFSNVVTARDFWFQALQSQAVRLLGFVHCRPLEYARLSAHPGDILETAPAAPIVGATRLTILCATTRFFGHCRCAAPLGLGPPAPEARRMPARRAARGERRVDESLHRRLFVCHVRQASGTRASDRSPPCDHGGRHAESRGTGLPLSGTAAASDPRWSPARAPRMAVVSRTSAAIRSAARRCRSSGAP